MSKKSKFPKMSRKCPKKSSRVPEWYTSGSWANAFDNTGWQKSPEYALIRIARRGARFGQIGQIRPDGPTEKSSRIWAPGLAFAPQAEILSGAVFPDTRTDLRSVDLFPRRVEFCDRVRHILQMCAHFAKHSLKTAVRAQDILHTVHTVHNRNTDVHTCAHRATAPDTSGREHIVHVLLLLGGGRCGASTSNRRMLIIILFQLFIFSFGFFPSLW